MSRFAIINVRVFDGQQILPSTTVLIDNGLIISIGAAPDSFVDETIIDGQNGVLIPGLIDAHVHLHGPESLKQLAQHGVTTGLDMACWPPSLVSSIRIASKSPGMTDIRSPGFAACAPGSRHSHLPGLPEDLLVSNVEDARRFVQERIAEGADYIKVIADLPGMDQLTLNALMDEAKSRGMKTICHAAQYDAFERALLAKTDVVTHVPTDKPVDQKVIQQMISQNTIAVPTLTMMDNVVKNLQIPELSYDHARDSVSAMYKAGVPILAGTDSNNQLGAPAKIKHGESIHDELDLLVEAGLSNLDALRAATVLPARHFGLNDRGEIAVGKRADLVLLKDDLIVNISATRSFWKVWINGVEVEVEVEVE
ncbi:hypothetical protein IFR05_001269 [Cadophora sp. M221]|nr:hypothetical protein IFR05_001269 [Cadophora sp. M221]